MNSVTKKAYGKINLILRVGEKRGDGKHEVLTVMQRVGVFDTVTVSKTEEKGIFIECDEPSLISPENLAFKAAEMYFEAIGAAPNVKISIKKRIPTAAGMAGGSSDAGATLTALCELYGKLEARKIHEIAARLGSDVPFFIYGDLAMLGRGDGSELTPFPSLFGELYGVFTAGGQKKGSTGEMYRLLDAAKGSSKTGLDGAENALRAAIVGGDMSAAMQSLENDFELCFKHIGALSRAFSECGAIRTLLCGSGPTVCGIFTDEAAARKASESLAYKSLVSRLLP